MGFSNGMESDGARISSPAKITSLNLSKNFGLFLTVIRKSDMFKTKIHELNVQSYNLVLAINAIINYESQTCDI